MSLRYSVSIAGWLCLVTACSPKEAPDGIWEVTESARILASEHVSWLPQGDEPLPLPWIDTYSIGVEDGTRQLKIIWTGTEQNPFNLSIGDRFTMSDSALDGVYSADHDGYYIAESSIRKLPK